MYLGIEIGGTKLQLAVGAGEGVLAGLWRGRVDPASGAEGIRRQIEAALPGLLTNAGVERSALAGVGIGFGGPVDDVTRTVIRSHQIEGWDGFPLADWVSEMVGLPAALGNDADVAGLAEALYGAGKGLSPIFYITVGSGIGGGLIVAGEIYRGVGRGAAEIGHLLVLAEDEDGQEHLRPLELVASGWAIESRYRRLGDEQLSATTRATLVLLAGDQDVRVQHLGALATQGNREARAFLGYHIGLLAEAIVQMIALVCPRRVVIGGGVALLGEQVFFAPLRQQVEKRVFRPFVGLTDIVPAALGEEVVLHGAIALARRAATR
jgi:glucokinase